MKRPIRVLAVGILACATMVVPVMAEEAVLPEESVVLEEGELSVGEDIVSEDVITDDEEILQESEEIAQDEEILIEADEEIVKDDTDDGEDPLASEDGVSGQAGANVTYKVEGNTLTLSGFGETATIKFGSYNEEVAFKASIRKVVVNNGIVTICANLFKDYPNLETVKIASSVKKIEKNAFYRCGSLRSIQLPKGLTYLGWGAIEECTSLESVTIPSTCTTIEDYCFNGDISLKKVVIKNGLQTIKYRAFRGCSSLESINIPQSVGQDGIGSEAFYGCEKLKTYGPLGEDYNIQTSNAYFYSRFPYVVKVVISGKTVNIPREAFRGCRSLESVKILKGVKVIGNNAFYQCSSLKKIELPEGLTSIEWGAIEECTALESVTVPSTCTKIGDYAFNGDISLKKVRLKEGLQTIKYRAFRGCKSLSDINIPRSVGQDKIESEAFAECEKLKTYGPTGGNYNVKASNVYKYARFPYVEKVVVPDKTVNIPDQAFSECTALKTVTIPKKVKTIGTYAFRKCSSLKSVTIENGLTSIGVGSFEYCTALTKITIPGSVKTIEGYAFANDISLKTVTLNEGLSTLKDRVFAECASLKKINVPNSVKSMGYNVFYNCANGFKIYACKKSTAEKYAKDYGIKRASICYIKYSANSGSGYMNTQYVNYSKSGKLAKPSYTKKGYKFKGWCADKKGKGKIYKAGSKITMKKNMTLYAIWKKK